VTPGGLPRPRILPVLIVAGLCLFALKLLGLASRGGYLIAPTVPVLSQAMPGAQVAPPPFVGLIGHEDITGSVPPKAEKPADKAGAKPAEKSTEKTPDKTPDKARPEPTAARTAAEIEVLEKLAQRRRQLEDRAKELELREAMLKTAEKTLEDKASSLRPAVAAGTDNKDSPVAAAQASLKSLVIMYEAMKPRDAGRVFEKLEPRMMITLARAMNPRKLAEIVAQMTPETAEKLTAGLMKPEGGDVPPLAAGAPAGAMPAAPAAAVPELPRLKPSTKPQG